MIPVDNDDEDGKYVNMQKKHDDECIICNVVVFRLLKLLLQIIGVFIALIIISFATVVVVVVVIDDDDDGFLTCYKPSSLHW